MQKIIMLIPLIFLAGCVHRISPDKLSCLSLGMTKAQVIEKIGEPLVVRDSYVNQDGKVIECFEYDVANLFDPIWLWRKYWLDFCDSKLIYWRQAGDFQPSHVQEIRYR